MDPGYPALHIRPASGWVNDPNGLCRVDGTWHVFFQHNPAAGVHGDICWGHVSSTDLLRWQEHPVALRPRPGGPDAAGCWSGCVVEDAGTPVAVYTAMPGDPAEATVATARSDRTLVRWGRRAAPLGAAAAGPGQVRDPFVFRYAGRRYAVQGAGDRGGRPSLLVHECTDLARWVARGTLLDDADPWVATLAAAEIWECPNLVQVDGRWVLVVSLWRSSPTRDVLAGSRWFLGDLEEHPGGLRFQPVAGGVLDSGPAWYAPQLLPDRERTLVWGWAMETARTEEECRRSGWAGALTFPRELRVREDRVVMVPAAELTGLRAGAVADPGGGPLGLPAFEVVATGAVRLELDGRTVVEVHGSPQDPARVLVDGGVVEAFAAGDAHTTRARPGADHGWTVGAAPGTTTVHRLALPAAGAGPC
ncbi:MAG TPA: glycoside hydrolase family 32 protein [Nocardioides sp.]|uniref:glycoside hydrolase family 32 protein n=1 Tax=Nocardioides sp. TaxID=35761 RepID=UPI002BF1C00B|nr:glycoside hydrolase family 32 protein [Nocardioides sp.]HQR25697.1 glycoside hydrolase family 32 protein [Nocardioides sp.]